MLKPLFILLFLIVSYQAFSQDTAYYYYDDEGCVPRFQTGKLTNGKYNGEVLEHFFLNIIDYPFYRKYFMNNGIKNGYDSGFADHRFSCVSYYANGQVQWANYYHENGSIREIETYEDTLKMDCG